MTITLTLGWWLLPALLTVITYGAALCFCQKPTGGDYDFSDAGNFLILALASIPVLISWLIWSLA